MVLSSRKVSKGRSGQEATVIALDGYCKKKKKNLKVRTVVTLQIQEIVSLAPELLYSNPSTEIVIFQMCNALNNSHFSF